MSLFASRFPLPSITIRDLASCVRRPLVASSLAVAMFAGQFTPALLAAEDASADDAAVEVMQALATDLPMTDPTANGDINGEATGNVIAQYTEDSVLVLTKKAEADAKAATDQTEDNPSEASLEPISQFSEFAPELAEPKSDSVPPISEPSLNDLEATEQVDPETDVADAYQAASEIRRAKFQDILPSVSTRDELISRWGEPVETTPNETGDVLLFDMVPFAGVEVLVVGDVVELIKVELEKQELPDRLAARLRADEVDSVELLDESGANSLGVAYPEKGIILLLTDRTASNTPRSPQYVSHVIIQPLDAEAFALRADSRDQHNYGERLADLNQAIKIDDQNAYARWLLAELYLATGQADKAVESAAIAVKADSTKDAYRLRLAQCLSEQGFYDRAVLETRQVLDSKAAPQVVRAVALHEMGLLASLGDSSIADKAIGFHTMAIGVADKLATNADSKDRRVAKRLLVDAHLAAAVEISRRKYARKNEIVAQWIGRASGLAEEIIANDQGSLELRLQVATEALAALANLKPTKDPAPWVKEAQETADALLAETKDTLFSSRVEWQLGQAYYHALRVEHTRREPEQAVAYGMSAIDHLSQGAATGEVRPSAEQLVGRLYFHLGATLAVHKQDHQQAVEWYEKAYPLLTAEKPKNDLVVPRRLGEALVSMAVSYWELDERNQAIELTIAGADLMEQAVAGGVLEEPSLAVPYGNLSTMHSKLGNRDESSRFAKLARTAKAVEGETRLTEKLPNNRNRSARQSQPTNRSAQALPKTQNTGSGQRTIMR